MITLSGLKPHEDIEIVFSGIRPGEKLVEETATDEEHVARTAKPKILIGKIAAYPAGAVDAALITLERLAESGDQDAIRRFLEELLPEARLGGGPGPKPASLQAARAGRLQLPTA
jgi:FlaA1/EpsC-like NDP-sugar epimerase